MMQRISPFVGFAAAVALMSCEDTSSSLDEDTLRSLLPVVVQPSLDQFAADAAALAVDAESFCAGPSDTGLATVQTSWDTARGSWKRLDVLAFGPYSNYPERYGSNIDFHPARPDTLDAYFEQGDDLTASDVAAAGASRRGLVSIEYALFGVDSADPGVCGYLVAASEDLANMAEGYAWAWAPEGGGFSQEMLVAGDVFMSPHAAVSEFVNRMGFTLENLRRDKLGAPLGASPETADPGAVESQFSQRSVQDARDAVAGVAAIFEGGPDPVDMGIVDQLEARSRGDIVDAFRAALSAADASLVAIDVPLADAVVTQREDVQAAIDALGVLQRVIQVDIAGALNTSVSFNDADGD